MRKNVYSINNLPRLPVELRITFSTSPLEVIKSHSMSIALQEMIFSESLASTRSWWNDWEEDLSCSDLIRKIFLFLNKSATFMTKPQTATTVLNSNNKFVCRGKNLKVRWAQHKHLNKYRARSDSTTIATQLHEWTRSTNSTALIELTKEIERFDLNEI